MNTRVYVVLRFLYVEFYF